MFKGEGSFARKQLEKHGWREGAGLGSREHGIAEAIKVKLKHDTRGVGHNAAKEFTHHWWDHAFNKAASSITVQEGEDGVVVSRKQSSKKERTVDAKKTLYSNFVKGSLLSNGTEEAVEKEKGDDDSSSDEEIEQKTHTLMLPEDELFQKCGGRTAHKGARHGLTANGKLSRVEQQERQLLEKYQQARTSTPTLRQPYSNPASVNGSRQNGETSPSSPQQDSQSEDRDRSAMSKSKKKKSKKRKRDEEEKNEEEEKRRTNDTTENGDCTAGDEKHTGDTSVSIEDSEPNPKRKKKCRKERTEVTSVETHDSGCITVEENREEQRICDGGDHSLKKKKKKSRKEKSDEGDKEKAAESPNVINQDCISRDKSSCSDSELPHSKKKKKKKSKTKKSEVTDDCDQQKDSDCLNVLSQDSLSVDRSSDVEQSNSKKKKKRLRKEKVEETVVSKM